MSDVFISYSRKDKDFVRVLHDALEKSERQTWVDWEDIPLTSEWWKEIEAGIEGADTFIFVISPDSAASKVCGEEISHAVKHNKRLFPIVRRDVAKFDPNNESFQALNKHNWLFFREEEDFEQAFQKLTTAISMDLGYVHNHTRLLVKAIEWDTNNRKEGSLLQKEILVEAENWLQTAIDKDPKPTDLQISYVENSRKVENANQRASKIKNNAFVVAVFLVVISLAGVWIAGGIASNQIKTANQKVADADTKIKTANKQVADAQKEADIIKADADTKIKTANKQVTDAKKKANIIKADADTKIKTANKQVTDAQKEADTIKADADTKIKTANKQVTDAQKEADIIKANADTEIKTANQKVTDAQKEADKINKTAQALAIKNREVQNNLENSKIQVMATEAKALWIDNPKTLDSLLVALKAGHLLQTRLSEGFNVPSIIQWKIKIALQQAESTIQERNRLGTQNTRINTIDFSPDGKKLVSGSQKGEIRLWEIATGKELKFFHKNSTAAVYSVNFSPNGKLIASSSEKGEIKLWDVETEKELYVSSKIQIPFRVRSVDFIPPGDILMSAGGDGSIYFWNIKTNEVLNFIPEPDSPSPIKAAILSHSGQIIAISDANGGTYLTRILQLKSENMEQKLIYPSLKDDVISLSFSNDDQSLVTGSASGKVRLWNIVKEQEEEPFFPRHDASVNSISYSPDGQLIATASDDGTVKLWLATGENQTPRNVLWHNDPVKTISFSPLKNGILASAGDNGIMKLWDLSIKKQPRIFPMLVSPDNEIKFSCDSRSLVIIANNGKRWFLDKYGANLSSQQISVENTKTFSCDRKIVAINDDDGTVKIRDQKKQKTLKIFPKLLSSIDRVSLSSDGKILASSNSVLEKNSGLLNLWDMDTGAKILTLSGHKERRIKNVQFSPDSKMLVSIDEIGTVILWNFDLDKLMQEGCAWIRAYLSSHPEQKELQQICQPYFTGKSSPKP
jgi:WD40 repeat protein